jgi:hypothetical protein
MATEVSRRANADEEISIGDGDFNFDNAVSQLRPGLQALLRRMDEEVEYQPEIEGWDGARFERHGANVTRKVNQTVYELLSRKSLWFYAQMRVDVGRTQIPLQYEHLGLSHDVLGKLFSAPTDALDGRKKRRIKPPSFTIFPQLQLLKTKLDNFRSTKIQTLMAYDGSSWFCDDQKMGEVELKIEEWQELLEDETRKVLHGYRAAKQEFLVWMAQWLEAVNERLDELGEDPLDVGSVLAEYEAKFPTRQTLIERIRITIVGPRRMYSLAEQAEHNATLAEELVRLEQANLSREQVEAARRGLERDQRAKEEAIRRGAEFIENRMAELVGRLLEQVDTVGQGGRMSDRRYRAVETVLEEINELMALPGASALEEFAEESETLAQLCRQTNLRRDEINRRITEIQQRLELELNRPAPTGIGTRVAPTRISFTRED